MNRKISAGLVVACFALMTLWDIYPALTPEQGDTISEVMRDVGTTYYVLPYIIGVLAGHFWINKKDKSAKSIPALWVTTGLMLSRDLLQFMTFPGGTPTAGALGIIAGAIWWPQAPKEETNADTPQE